MVDEIDVLDSEEEDAAAAGAAESAPCHSRAPQLPRQPEPIVIRGVGQITMFGLSSRFGVEEFPSALMGKLAPEELQETMRRINCVLQRNMHTHVRWLLCGLLFCCCTLGCSLWPVVCLSKRTLAALEKTLDHENQQLYNKLGLHWHLAKCPVENSSTSALSEYVLLLEIIPKIPLLVPD